VQKALKRGTARVEKRTATQQESDNLAADAALWLAHELLYGNGERNLVKNPPAETFQPAQSIRSRTGQENGT